MRLVIFDGPDGSGKTKVALEIQKQLKELGQDTEYIRFPGAHGSEICNGLRSLIIEGKNPNTRATYHMLWADFYQAFAELIAPRKDTDTVFILDRFVSSTLVYQGFFGGVPLPTITGEGTLILQEFPFIREADFVLFDARPEVLAARLQDKRADFNRFDQMVLARLEDSRKYFARAAQICQELFFDEDYEELDTSDTKVEEAASIVTETLRLYQ